MKAIVCLLIVCSALLMRAQAPGYMGKRFNAGYGFYFSPALNGSNGMGQSMRDGYPVFNSQHELFAEYALSTHLMLGASVKLYRTSYDNRLSRYMGGITYLNANGGTEYFDFGSNDLSNPYFITGRNYTVYIKKYSQRYVAPWGRYAFIGPSIQHFTARYDEKFHVMDKESYDGFDATSIRFGPPKQSFIRADVVFGCGRTRILGDCVSIDYGFCATVFGSVAAFFDTVDVAEDAFGHKPEDYIPQTAPIRARAVNRFNVYLKIGGLLF